MQTPKRESPFLRLHHEIDPVNAISDDLEPQIRNTHRAKYSRIPWIELDNDGTGPATTASTWINGWKRLILVFTLGQFLSLMLTLTAYSANSLAVKYDGKWPPCFVGVLVYTLLLIVYGPIVFLSTLSTRNEDSQIFSLPPIKTCLMFSILGFLDLEANFILISAYKYTSALSVMLLDAWAIPCVLILGWIISKRIPLLEESYVLSGFKISGVLLSIFGLGGLVFVDTIIGRLSPRDSGGNPILGDTLVLIGASIYALSNLSQEFLVKFHDKNLILFLLGLFGSIFGWIQVFLTEAHFLRTITFDMETVGYMFIFAFALFCFYSIVPVFLQISSAPVLNLSILTADFYVALMEIIIFKYSFHPLYFLFMIFIISGLLVYHGREIQIILLKQPEQLEQDLE